MSELEMTLRAKCTAETDAVALLTVALRDNGLIPGPGVEDFAWDWIAAEWRNVFGPNAQQAAEMAGNVTGFVTNVTTSVAADVRSHPGWFATDDLVAEPVLYDV